MLVMTINRVVALDPSRPSERREQSPLEAGAARQEVVMLREFGGPEGFELLEQPLPAPGPGEVRVRVLAASVQFTDVLLRMGKYPNLKEKPPLVLGYDVVGEVDEVGPGVTSLRVGERVADLTITGSYARYRTLHADSVTRVPEGVDAAEAVTVVLSWVTAYQLLHREAHAQKGQRMLVHGAAGAVGQALLALGQLAGLTMWGTTSTAHAGLVRSLGATSVDSVHGDLRALVPDGFDIVFDGIGERGFAASWAAVRDGGTLCAFGVTSAIKSEKSLLVVGWWLLRLQIWNRLWPRKAAKFYSITSVRKQHPDWFQTDLQQLFELLSQGSIHPHVAARIDLDGVADAHRRLEAGGLEGKVVIVAEPGNTSRGREQHGPLPPPLRNARSA